MKTMLVSEFKAKCIAALKEVYRSREPMVVTLRGKPIVTIQPFAEFPQGKQLDERLKDLERSGFLVRSALPRRTFRPVERRPGALSRFLAERDE